MISKYMERAASRDYSEWWQAAGSFPDSFQKKKAPLDRPYSTRENYLRTVKGQEPYWIPIYGLETNIVWPDAIEEHPVPEVDGFDWWGVDWYMEPGIGGMITRPGTRVISEFANWKQDIEWPDLSVVDFRTDGIKVSENYDPNRIHIFECTEGLFERLHEMMPFDESLLAFYEEPELLEEFFSKMADYKIECCQKVFEYYGQVDGVLYHDDWGTEKAGFFSNEMFQKQLMPETKRFFDYLHEQGKFVELHSCGRNMQYVPLMIEMGIDCWTPQWRCNNLDWLYHTYGNQMSFTIPLIIESSASENEVRNESRRFVERYGESGRTICWVMSENSAVQKIAEEEIVNYSIEYYNKKFNR